MSSAEARPDPRPLATSKNLASVLARRTALKEEPERAQKMATGWAAAAATVTTATVATSVFSTRDDLRPSPRQRRRGLSDRMQGLSQLELRLSAS
jgi:hypothetical protein